MAGAHCCSKGNQLEIFNVTQSGIDPFLEIPIYGRASVMQTFRPDGSTTDLLAVLTEKSDFFVLRYDFENKELVTLFSANVLSTDSVPTKTAQRLCINAKMNLIVIHVSIGLLELIAFEARGTDDIYFKKPSRVGILELEIYDISAIDSFAQPPVPTLAVLHKLPLKLPQIKTYRILEKKNVMVLEPEYYSMSEISDDANIIARVGAPRGGFLVVGSKKIVYTNPLSNVHRQLVIIPSFFTCISPIDVDGYRFLMATSSGELHVLLLLPGGESSFVEGLRLEKLGKLPTIASSITYIDDGIVYIGSQYGDSILIKLSCESLSTLHEPNGRIIQQYFQVLETYPSLAPISDICIYNRSKFNSPDQYVVAAGAAHAGALKVVSSGIEALSLLQADIDEKNVVNLFAFPESNDNSTIQCIHLVTPFSTRCFSLNYSTSELEEKAYGLSCNQTSLWIQRYGKNDVVQVTPTMILLTKLDSKPRSTGSFWQCPDGIVIRMATALSTFLLIYTSDNHLRVMNLQTLNSPQTAEFQMQEEIASLTVLRDQNGHFLCVSYWVSRKFAFITSSDGFQSIEEMPVDSTKEDLVRSAGLLYNGSTNNVVVLGTMHGKVFVCSTPSRGGQLLETLRLGYGPVSICSLDDPTSVLAQCDGVSYLLTIKQRGSVSKHVISNLPSSINAMSHMQLGQTMGIIFFSNNALTFSTLQHSKNPQMHIKSHHVGQSIHKIVCLPEHHLIATIQHNFPVLAIPVEHWPMLRSELVLYDEQTFEVVDRHKLRSGNELPAMDISSRFSEMGWCLAAGKLDGLVDNDDQGEGCLVLGTGYCTDNPQFEKGRLMVFKIGEGRKLCSVSANEVDGVVKTVAVCNGHVVASVSGQTIFYRWEYQLAKSLLSASASGGHMDGTCVSSLGNVLAVGDTLTSVSFCHLDFDSTKIKEIARAHRDRYITALQLLDQKSAVAADIAGNLATFAMEKDAHCDYTIAAQKGSIHVGDMINAIIRDSSGFLGASASGALYRLHVLNRVNYAALQQLQKALQGMATSVGGIKHSTFRKAVIDPRTQMEMSSFIDGDLMTRFLALSKSKQREALGIKGTAEDETEADKAVQNMIKLIEGLSFE